MGPYEMTYADAAREVRMHLAELAASFAAQANYSNRTLGESDARSRVSVLRYQAYQEAYIAVAQMPERV